MVMINLILNFFSGLSSNGHHRCVALLYDIPMGIFDCVLCLMHFIKRIIRTDYTKQYNGYTFNFSFIFVTFFLQCLSCHANKDPHWYEV